MAQVVCAGLATQSADADAQVHPFNIQHSTKFTITTVRQSTRGTINVAKQSSYIYFKRTQISLNTLSTDISYNLFHFRFIFSVGLTQANLNNCRVIRPFCVAELSKTLPII